LITEVCQIHDKSCNGTEEQRCSFLALVDNLLLNRDKIGREHDFWHEKCSVANAFCHADPHEGKRQTCQETEMLQDVKKVSLPRNIETEQSFGT
jgi:hypothetical protein